jgi:hypothetical protein
MTILGTLLAAVVFSRTQGMLDPEINDHRVWRPRSRVPVPVPVERESPHS